MKIWFEQGFETDWKNWLMNNGRIATLTNNLVIHKSDGSEFYLVREPFETLKHFLAIAEPYLNHTRDSDVVL